MQVSMAAKATTVEAVHAKYKTQIDEVTAEIKKLEEQTIKLKAKRKKLRDKRANELTAINPRASAVAKIKDLHDDKKHNRHITAVGRKHGFDTAWD